MTTSGSAKGTMVDQAGGATLLFFDNEGPPGITEIVFCIGSDGWVILVIPLGA